MRDLLNMQGGIACNDQDSVSPGNEENMYGTRDWTKFLLNLRADLAGVALKKPVEAHPGDQHSRGWHLRRGFAGEGGSRPRTGQVGRGRQRWSGPRGDEARRYTRRRA